MTPAAHRPRFSVIIPTFNRRDLLLQTLASVWRQTCADYEVIVVDDGSTDDTWSELQSLGHRLRAYRQNNTGPSAARNFGALQATGEYLIFLDSDDLWFPEALQSFATAIEANGSPAVVCGKIQNFSVIEEVAFDTTVALSLDAYPCYGAAAARGIYAGAGMLAVLRPIFLKAGGFNTTLKVCEDHDFMLKLTTEPGFVRINSPTTLARRRSGGNLSAETAHLYAAMDQIIDRESKGGYPGGPAFAGSRRHIISQHCRTVVLALVRARELRSALRIYARSLPWQVLNHRWKFVLGTPVHCLATLVRPR